MKKRVSHTTAALAAMLAFATTALHAATINVSGGGAALQNAINTANADDTLRVGPGTYSPITSNNKKLTIESTDGAAATIINGGGTQRCATLAVAATLSLNPIQNDTVLTGFTLMNGRHVTTEEMDGGGGAFGGTLNNCVLRNNTAFMGGGACVSWLNNCTILNNSAEGGGGTFCGVIYNSYYSGNSADASGGGGAFDGALYNCLLTGNTAAIGGGACMLTLNNCTLVGNSCTTPGMGPITFGGGAFQCTINNSIIWGNTCGTSTDNCSFLSTGSLQNSCTTSLPGAPYDKGGNITANPRFVNAAGADYFLQSNSPCIDAGRNFYTLGGQDTAIPQTDTDLNGAPRIQNKTVDMGAYEFNEGEPLPTPTLTVSPTSKTVEWSANSFRVTVTSSVGWTVTGNADWISVSAASGINDGSFWISCLANTGAESRAGIVTVSGGGITRTITVTQVAEGEEVAPDENPYLSNPDDAEDTALTVTTAYDGFVYDADNKTVRGTLTLSAKVDKNNNWAFSAKAVLQAATVSFSKKQPGPIGDVVTLTAKGGESLILTLGAGRLHGTLSGGKAGGAFNVDGARSDKATRLTGLYNVALLSGGGIPEAPVAMGYVSLSVGSAGAVKYAGQLMDGTKVSGSARLLAGLNTDGWLAAALYSPLYSKNGFISGLLWIAPSPSGRIVRVDTDNGWLVDWKRASAAQPDRLDVLGGYFGDGKAAPQVPGGLMTFSADVPMDLLPLPAANLDGWWVDEAFPSGLSFDGKFKLPKATTPKLDWGNGEYDYSGENPSGATLTYTAKTGLFKGSFKLYYDGYDLREKFQHKTFSVSYSGVMVPVEGGGLLGLGTGTATVNKQKVGLSVRIEN